MGIGLVLLIGSAFFSFGLLVGLILGYYRMCIHLAHDPDSPWWVFIERRKRNQ